MICNHMRGTNHESMAEEPDSNPLVRFLFPRLNRRYLVRLGLVAVTAYLFFGHICIPAFTRGESMLPTYANGAFTFCWRPRFWLRKPRSGDVVMVHLAGRRVMYLKRVVAVAGDVVEFRDGKLLVNDLGLDEPYVKTACSWGLEKRTVPVGQVYVVGDNRGMPMAQHKFGKVAVERIVGGALW